MNIYQGLNSIFLFFNASRFIFWFGRGTWKSTQLYFTCVLLRVGPTAIICTLLWSLPAVCTTQKFRKVSFRMLGLSQIRHHVHSPIKVNEKHGVCFCILSVISKTVRNSKLKAEQLEQTIYVFGLIEQTRLGLGFFLLAWWKQNF